MTITTGTDRMTRSAALDLMGQQGWHASVNLTGVLDDALGDADLYRRSDVLDLCGLG